MTEGGAVALAEALELGADVADADLEFVGDGLVSFGFAVAAEEGAEGEEEGVFAAGAVVGFEFGEGALDEGAGPLQVELAVGCVGIGGLAMSVKFIERGVFDAAAAFLAVASADLVGDEASNGDADKRAKLATFFSHLQKQILADDEPVKEFLGEIAGVVFGDAEVDDVAADGPPVSRAESVNGFVRRFVASVVLGASDSAPVRGGKERGVIEGFHSGAGHG